MHPLPVDNFDLSLNISEPAEPSPPPPPSRPGICRPSGGHGQLHHNRDHGGNYITNNNMAVDQTFHTPSFGDEDFDLAPPLGSLHGHPGGAQASASSAAPVAVSIPTASESPTPAAPPPHPPSTVSPDSHLECYGGRQTTSNIQHHPPPPHQTHTQLQQHSPTYGQHGEAYMQPPPPPPPQPHHHVTMQQQAPPPQQQLIYDSYGNIVNIINPHLQHQQQMQHHMNYVQSTQMQILGPPGPPQQMQMISPGGMHLQQGMAPGHHPGPHQHAMQHQMGHCRPGSAGSGSPPTSNHTSSPGLETNSEDSDDCTPLTQLMGGLKRPSPEPMEPSPMVVHNMGNMGPTKPLPGVKKPKVQKKKKKRDPNEPQKPVSAYALFFRDTQAAIKGQNPNASFGEVSKIVASMWDSLDADHKNIYKRKTEAAKKEYLKALAAYRASLVSKAAADQSDSLYGSSLSNNNNTMPPGGHHQQQHMTGGGGGLSPLQKKSPLLTSLMEVGGGMPTSNAPHFMGTNTPPSSHPPSAGQMGQHPSMSPGSMSAPSQQNHIANMMGMAARDGGNSPMVPMGSQQGHHAVGPQQTTTGQEQQPQQQQNNGGNGSQQQSSSPNGGPSFSPNYQVNSGGGNSGGGNGQGNFAPSPPSGSSGSQGSMQTCLRSGCTNPAIDSPDWDREYCSSECVVSHCRDVFTHWVSARQVTPANTYASVK